VVVVEREEPTTAVLVKPEHKEPEVSKTPTTHCCRSLSGLGCSRWW
jgi:hypothetical protein